MGTITTLDRMLCGARGVVRAVKGDAAAVKRFAAMGITPGREITKECGAGKNPTVIDVAGAKTALGQAMASAIEVEYLTYKLLLTGNPNVGKSVVFSRLTGLDVISSNFPGTTVEFLSGTARLAGRHFTVTDVPGAYSIEPACKAEDVACALLNEGKYDIVVHVLDATNLERNLFFALQVLELEKPAVLLLNKSDTAKMRGISIDCDALARKLGVPCVPFVAVTGEGITGLSRAVAQQLDNPQLPPPPPASDDGKWQLIGRVSKEVQKISHRHPSLLEQIAELSARPAAGLPIAALALVLSFLAVRGIGEGLVNYVLDPLFNAVYLPALNAAVSLSPWAGLNGILLGGGAALSGFGALTTGVYVALVSVLAYIIAFYAVFGFLEDLGYLPRLAVLLDRALHRVGLHGYGSIPILLGLGCKVPGILAARVLETRRERIIALSLLMLVAPCVPQTAMILSLVGPLGLKYAAAVFLTLAATGVAAGIFLNKLLKGETPELFIEIPQWHWPKANVLAVKLRLRVKNYVYEAVPMIILGTLAIALADKAGILAAVSRAFEYPLTALLGLPKETASVVILGFLRKDVSIALLKPFALGAWQLVTASVFLSLYLPCLAAFSVMVKEAGVKDALKIVAFNLAAALLVSALLRFAYLLSA